MLLEGSLPKSPQQFSPETKPKLLSASRSVTLTPSPVYYRNNLESTRENGAPKTETTVQPNGSATCFVRDCPEKNKIFMKN